ncbi:MAG: MaoC family dehydratase N-terminal domain-containing protein [Ideonella sp.]|jgi:acyl dehydratase|nr:MaoC family dehydratase N-terminal domain-containing protein [Ideonella sp.]MBL0147651.1 MaoC family dehydratase N-terminal domain-containing protein [Ideonella sp.]
MSLNRAMVGHCAPEFTLPVEASRLRLFAKAIGETDPIYTEESAARAAGHPALPVPPTYLFCLESESPHANGLRAQLGVDYTRLLHGEQRFRYHRMCFAGDTLTFRQRIADIYDKKGGALEFAVRETEVRNQRGEPVATLTNTLVQRHA